MKNVLRLENNYVDVSQVNTYSMCCVCSVWNFSFLVCWVQSNRLHIEEIFALICCLLGEFVSICAFE